MKVPKYVQIAIKRMLFHQRVVRNNTEVVNKWMKKNNIDHSTPLSSFIDKLPSHEKIADGQMSIYDFIKGDNV